MDTAGFWVNITQIYRVFKTETFSGPVVFTPHDWRRAALFWNVSRPALQVTGINIPRRAGGWPVGRDKGENRKGGENGKRPKEFRTFMYGVHS